MKPASKSRNANTKKPPSSRAESLRRLARKCGVAIKWSVPSQADLYQLWDAERQILAGRVRFSAAAGRNREEFLRWWHGLALPANDPFDIRAHASGVDVLLPLTYVLKDHHARIFDAVRTFVALGDRDRSDPRVPKRPVCCPTRKAYAERTARLKRRRKFETSGFLGATRQSGARPGSRLARV
jgi:hypothetical protein